MHHLPNPPRLYGAHREGVLWLLCCFTLQGFPTWQVLLIDLRCHGESAAAAGKPYTPGPHTVESAAQDILALLRQLKLFPNMLIGHSFGGKVVMSMAQQFGKRLPRPVQVSSSLTTRSGFVMPLCCADCIHLQLQQLIDGVYLYAVLDYSYDMPYCSKGRLKPSITHVCH